MKLQSLLILKGNQRYFPVYSLILLIFLTYGGNTFGQTTVFTDDFNRATLGTTGGTPTMTWTAGSTTTPVGQVQTKGTSPEYAVQISTNPTTAGYGRDYLTGPLSTFSSPFTSTLKNNTGDVAWSFNMGLSNRAVSPLATAFNLASSVNSCWGSAVILAMSNANPTNAATNGYAVVMTQGATGTGYIVFSLVRFAGGLTASANVTSIIGTSSEITPRTNWVSIKVIYTPSTDTWKLYVRADAVAVSSATAPDPSTASTQVGSATVDNTYTSVAMSSCGLFLNHSNNSATDNWTRYDNFKVVVGAAAPTISSFTPTSAGNGTSVTITGTNLLNASAVSFGGTAATSFSVVDATTITAVVASGTSGNVSVTTAGGTATKSGFIWLQPATIISGAQTNADYTFTEESVVNVPNGATLTINGITTVNRITIEGGGKVTNNSDFTVTTSMTINSDGNGTGTYVDKGTSAINATVNQDLVSVRNWYISSPISAAQSNTLTPLGTLWKYNETNTGLTESPGTSLWDVITANETLTVMKGYIFKPTSAGLISFTGALNTGDKSITLDRTENTKAGRGFNLVGNPYPSYLNWMMAIDVANTGTSNMSTTLWYRTKNPGTFVFPNVPAYFVFDTYNETASTGTNNNGGGDVTGMIAPMQSFWVRVKAALDNSTTTGTLKFTNAMREHESGTNRLKAPSAKNVTQQMLRLQVSNAVNTDESIVLFNSKASNDLDDYDSPKMTNSNTAIPEIYTTVDKEQLVINGLNSISDNMELTLGFKTGKSDKFTIKAMEVSNFNPDTRIILKDFMLNSEFDLTSGNSYIFSSDATNTSSRFAILFKTPSIANSIKNFNDESWNVFVNENDKITIQHNNNDNGVSVTIYNAVGQKLISNQMTESCFIIDKSFGAGVYYVTLNKSGNKTTKKIIVN